jgi:hypothetical protein
MNLALLDKGFLKRDEMAWSSTEGDTLSAIRRDGPGRRCPARKFALP